MPSDFRSRLKRGNRLLGTMVTLACPATAEVLANIGFDWLFVDGGNRDVQGAIESTRLA